MDMHTVPQPTEAANYKAAGELWRREAERSRKMGWFQQAHLDDLRADMFDSLYRMRLCVESRVQ